MSRRDKRIRKIRQNMKNVRREDLDIILQDAGFTPDNASGSHVTYRHSSGTRVTVVAHGAIVPTYIVKQALAAIDSVQEAQDDLVESEEDVDGESNNE